MKFIILLSFVGIVCGATENKGPKFGKELVDQVNGQKGNSFKARLYPQFMEERFKKHYELAVKSSAKLGAELLKRPKRQAVPENQPTKDEELIPENFDLGDKYPQCAKVFKRLTNVGTCVGAVQVLPMTGMLTDRRYIVSNGILKVPISAWDVLTCFDYGVDDFGEPIVFDRCEEESASINALLMYQNLDGIVTGGHYETNKFNSHGCKPWPLSPTADYKTVSRNCSKECRPQYTDKTYQADKRTGSTTTINFLMTDDSSMETTQREIMSRGSVILFLTVNEDFFQYSSGVYQNIAQQPGKPVIYTMLRLQGWGVDENGVKYWRGPFVYGRNWGESGYVRILRGKYDVGSWALAVQTAYALVN